MKRNIGTKRVEAIGLGCMSLHWAYGEPPSRMDAERLLHRALDLGYDHLDTARIYGLGANEALIGETLAGRRNEFFLASKTGILVEGKGRRIDCRPETIMAAVEASLQSLRTDHIDLYYLHRRDFSVPIEESVGALARAVGQGKIGGIGLSEMSAETLRRAAAVHPIAAMQSEYSPMTRQPEIAVIEACRTLGTAFVAFSPVGRGALGGMLQNPQTLIEGDLRHQLPRFQGENWLHNRALIAQFAALAQDAGVTPTQLALGWVLAQGEHIVAIPGTASIAHLEENLDRRDWLPDAATCAAVNRLMNQKTIAGPRYPPAMQRSIDTEDFEVD